MPVMMMNTCGRLVAYTICTVTLISYTYKQIYRVLVHMLQTVSGVSSAHTLADAAQATVILFILHQLCMLNTKHLQVNGAALPYTTDYYKTYSNHALTWTHTPA
jgi:hypothetical protein